VSYIAPLGLLDHLDTLDTLTASQQGFSGTLITRCSCMRVLLTRGTLALHMLHNMASLRLPKKPFPACPCRLHGALAGPIFSAFAHCISNDISKFFVATPWEALLGQPNTNDPVIVLISPHLGVDQKLLFGTTVTWGLIRTCRPCTWPGRLPERTLPLQSKSSYSTTAAAPPVQA
jgi:hypothetical protein